MRQSSSNNNRTRHNRNNAKKLYFASSNKHKFQETQTILKEFGICVDLFKTKSLREIQSKSLREIAKMKSIDAFDMCKRPVLVEDAGIVIDALDGFPGPYSSFVFDTIGNKGILKLLNGKKNRQAKFVSVMAYCDKKLQPKIFEGIVTGKISTKIVGKGWGYDPIFIPYSNHNNTSKETYAISSNKNKTSHRYKSLQKFAKWWLQ